MSLLMDALKRAESSKQTAARNLTGNEPAPARAPDFSLEPIAVEAPIAAGKSLPNLAQHLDSLNADLASGVIDHATASVAPAPVKDDENRAAIRNAFAAKTEQAPSRKSLWITLGALGVGAIGIGIYVWTQLQGMSQGSMAASNVQPSLQSGAESPRPLPTTLPPPQYPSAPPAVPVLAPNPASTVTLAEETPRARNANAFPVERQESPRYAASADGRQDFASSPVRLTRTSPEPDTNLQRGYTHLQGNSLAQARQDYEQALRNDPNNVDTLLGLAAIAQRMGRPADADGFRQRALNADPRDPAAQAAVLGSSNSSNPSDTESRLKTMLAAQPESAPLNFALGNLYAKQSRWNEAQQVYFNAVAGDTENPDYLFNLAVSLDQMRQPKLAAQHYRLALDAAERRPAAFDRERLLKRMSQLQP